MTATNESAQHRTTAEEWVRRTCTLLAAAVAAYASYQHQREYALLGGADPTSAALWPLSVDGLLVLATVGVLQAERLSPRGRVAVWLRVGLRSVLVAGWPPVALLLAVELLAHGPLAGTSRDRAGRFRGRNRRPARGSRHRE
jgi:hypothetical protein